SASTSNDCSKESSGVVATILICFAYEELPNSSAISPSRSGTGNSPIHAETHPDADAQAFINAHYHLVFRLGNGCARRACEFSFNRQSIVVGQSWDCDRRHRCGLNSDASNPVAEGGRGAARCAKWLRRLIDGDGGRGNRRLASSSARARAPAAAT